MKEKETITSGKCICDNPRLVVCEDELGEDAPYRAYVRCNNCQRHNDWSTAATALDARAATLNLWNFEHA